MTHQSGCLLCGAELEYFAEHRSFSCHFCGTTASGNVHCVNGHYICDSCHRGSAQDVIESACINSEARDPVSLAETLMKHPAMNMHGPEHHFLVPAVLLSTYAEMKDLPKEEKAGLIRKARQRSEDVKGGFCGLHGACGAGIGTGIFVSLITSATPLSTSERGLSNRMTAESLLNIARTGGARCCKRDSLLAIFTAVQFLEAEFGIVLPANREISCAFSHLNRECLESDCPFHQEKAIRLCRSGKK
ncbi:MAG: SAM-dependent methyltransferase [Deltaproteobacteria bacterium]|nr:SAM-dependent methyltransferase [Deltaproteobacteria bacterium]TLN01276.1 MAG: SAM-dependent methyltransferase [bacterium]